MSWHRWVESNHRIGSVRCSLWLPRWLRHIGFYSRVFGTIHGDRVVRCGRSLILWGVPMWLTRLLFRAGLYIPGGKR